MDRDRIIKIKDMMEKIKDKQIFKEIFYIAQPELQSIDVDCKYSHNDIGIFFDLKVLSDNTLLKIEELLKTTLSATNTESETISYNIYYNDDNK
jgi:hypothetical protein